MEGMMMKPFIPKTKSYYAVMFRGLDPVGCTGTYITVIDGYNKKDAMKALQKEVEPNGVTILKITHCVSFAEREGATWLAKKWDAISNEILINGALMNKPILYMLDKTGQPKEVKIIRDPDVFEVNVPSPVSLPEFSSGIEFSMEAAPGAFKELELFLKEHDQQILEAYDTFAKALECCMQDIRRCRECPLKEADSCRGLLLHNAIKVLLNHKKLHRETMLVNLEKEKRVRNAAG